MEHIIPTFAYQEVFMPFLTTVLSLALRLKTCRRWGSPVFEVSDPGKQKLM